MMKNVLFAVMILIGLGGFLLPSKAQEDQTIQNGEAEWSPDGTKIVYSSSRDGDFDIWVMDADGGNPVNLTPMMGHQSFPKWSPDGAFIAFVSLEPDQASEWGTRLRVMGADGSNLTRLSPDDQIQHVAFYSWSPDSQYIAYQLQDKLTAWTVKRDGTDRQVFTVERNYRYYGGLFWITSGEIPDYPDDMNLEIIPFSEEYSLVLNYLFDYDPPWPCISNDWCLTYARDGNMITVSSKDEGFEQTFAVEPSLRIAEVYSDGRVVFVTQQNEASKIWLLDALTGDIQLLLSETGLASERTEPRFELAWSPDGQRILLLWNNARYNWRELWLIHADGSEVRNLTCDNTDYMCGGG
jgi:dipeptidyl aminopeptidase/acylaminoacyl peptidase